MDRLQRTCKPMILYFLSFLLVSLGHHAYRFHELQCIQVRAVGFWTHTLYEILGNLGLYAYNKYPFSNHAPATSEKHYYQPTSMFHQPGLELDSMTQKISASRPNGGMNVYLLAFIATLVAPIIAALSIKIKLILCAFVASVLATSMALVSAIVDWDLISEFLHGIALTSPAYVPFAMMLFAPALAIYYLALGQRPPVCLFDFAPYHIPYENSLFRMFAVTQTPDTNNNPTRSSVQVNVPHEHDNDVEEIPREDLRPEISSRDLARIDRTYNYNITPSRARTRTGHLRLRIDDVPGQQSDFSILSRIPQSTYTGRQGSKHLIHASPQNQNARFIQNQTSTRNKVLPRFPSLSSSSACRMTRALSTTNPGYIPLTLVLGFHIAMWALSTEMTHFVPVSRELVVRFNLREVIYRWWSTQLSDTASRKIASQQLVRYFDLQDSVKSWAKRRVSKANSTKSQNLLLPLSTSQACFYDVEYAPILSTFIGTFIGFGIEHQGYPIQSATTQTSDRPLHQLDTLKPNTSPRYMKMLEQALPDSEVRDQVLPEVATKSSTCGDKSETQPSLETDPVSEAQPPSETDPTPRVRRRRPRSKPRSTSELIAYLKETDVPRKRREVSDFSPARRERFRRSWFKHLIRKSPTEAGVNSASCDKESPQHQVTPDSQAQVPVTTTSGSPTSVTDGAAGDFAEVAESDQTPSISTSGSSTAVTDGAAGDFTGVADGKDGASDEPGQKFPASLDQSSHTTGPATSVSDGAVVGFAVVDKTDQGDTEKVSPSLLPVDSDHKETTEKDKKRKGKGKTKKRSKTQDFAFRRRFFDEHRSTTKRGGPIDLDLLASLSEGMNGKDLSDIFFLIPEDKKSNIEQADFEAAIARQRQKMEAQDTYSTKATSSKALNTSGSPEMQKEPGPSSSDEKPNSVDALPQPSASTTSTSPEALDTSASVPQPPSNTPSTTDASSSTSSSSLKSTSPASSEPSHSPEPRAPSKLSSDKGAIGVSDSSKPKSTLTFDFVNSSDPKTASDTLDSAVVPNSAPCPSPPPIFNFNYAGTQDSGDKSSVASAPLSTINPEFRYVPIFDFTESSGSEAADSRLESTNAPSSNTLPFPRPTKIPVSKKPSQSPSSEPRLPPGPIFAGYQGTPPPSNNASSRKPGKPSLRTPWKAASKIPGMPEPSTPDNAQNTQPRPSDINQFPSSMPTWTKDSIKHDPSPGTNKDTSPKVFKAGARPVGQVDFSIFTPPLTNDFFKPTSEPDPMIIDEPCPRSTPPLTNDFFKPTSEPDPMIIDEPCPKSTGIADPGEPVNTQGPTDGEQPPLLPLEANVRAIRADRNSWADFDADVHLEELAKSMTGFTDDQISLVIKHAMEIADDFYTCIVHHTDFEEAITLVKPNIKEATDATDHSGDVPNNDAPPSAGAQDPSVKERNEPVSILNDPTRIEMFQTFTPGFLHFKRSPDISYSALLDETDDFTLEDCEETVKSAIKSATEDGKNCLRQMDFDRAIMRIKTKRSRRAPLDNPNQPEKLQTPESNVEKSQTAKADASTDRRKGALQMYRITPTCMSMRYPDVDWGQSFAVTKRGEDLSRQWCKQQRVHDAEAFEVIAYTDYGGYGTGETVESMDATASVIF
ncbi:hypothetical protein G7Y79_00010g028010 [Physcia stellaris]|nr:hypothetical protein G7Y79_00010g028010 [Physcia stellaris]